MIVVLGVLNLLLGTAYFGYGVVTATEMKRDWRSFGFSHFGAAWITMSFTCGPHHLIHGYHITFEGQGAGPLDLVAVVAGLPVGVLWLSLRVEAFLGGRGDRFIVGIPGWLRAMPALALLYTAVMVVAGAGLYLGGGADRWNWSIAANFTLVIVYLAVGYYVLRTQLRNHPTLGGWSVSGLCLAAIFPTCALMHGVWAVYVATGTYYDDVHHRINDWLSVPAALYFLWVVHRLYQDALRDWNRGPDEVAATAEPFSLVP
ncbi:MAG TPA: hypothetical protein VI854_02725 [Acidimicrobiia bacterium]|nr:hypothetical protein [Acidimicrobiia bacterium]